MALTRVDASRVSPLLGLKIIFLTVIGILIMGESYSPLQWVAALLAVCAALLLNWTGGSLPRQSILWILVACINYSISDMNIKSLVGCFRYLGLIHAAALSAGFSYVICGLFGIGIYLFLPRMPRKAWAYAVPFAVSWFMGMLFLFACFSSIGVVYGNIIQSSRGIISVVMGVVIAGAGLIALEQKTSRAVFFRRIAAAVLMSGAIALFYLGSG